MTKKILLLIVTTLLPLMASAHDIEVKNADGVTIYYNYINNGTELAVTFRGSDYSSYSNEYQGNVVVPEEVTFMNRTRKVTSIGGYAFYDCSSLTSVTIPNSVTSIGEGAFYGCSGLTSIEIPNSVTSIGEGAFLECSGLTSVTIGNSVTSIGGSAFYYCEGLTSVTIPNSVTSIGGYAFYDCSSLTSVTIPNSVTSIGEGAFYGCSGLTSIEIPNSVTSIGEGAFLECSGLTSVTIGNSVTSIGGSAFYYCEGLTSVTIPNSVTSIGNSAFASCSGLTSITIPNSVTSIEYGAFRGCSGLTSIEIPNSVTSIGEGAFWNCSGLTSVTIPNSVTSIGGGAFYECSGLTSVTIPNSVTSIGSSAFDGCSGLTSVTIGSGVTSIGDWVFDGANIPTIISLIENPSAINGKTSSYRTFSQNTFMNATLYVPKGTIEKYKATDGWKDFLFIEEGNIPEFLRGDVNGDEIINGTDIQAIINLIVESLYDEKADVNEDGVVNGTDIQEVINIIINGDIPDDPNIPVVGQARRTVIAYMDGNQVGNSMPQFLNLDIKEMVKGSDKLPADVNLVVFANIRGEKPYIAKLSGGESIKVREWESNFLATNPDSMLSVMKWIIDKYPAKEYATIFGGHGTGSLVYTDTVATKLPRICAYGWDYDNGKAIWMNSQTLGTVMSHLPHMKLVFIDCCLMQDIEVANNIKRYTDYIIAPLCETPITGAPYENIVPLLSTSDIETLCTDVINAYTEANGICISALRTSGMTNLFNVTREAINEIKNDPNYDASKLYDNCIYYYRKNRIVDPVLYELQDILYEQNQGHILSDATYQKFLDAIGQCVFYKHFVTWWVSDPSVGINFNDFTVTDENFGGLSISRETIEEFFKGDTGAE